MSDRVYCIKEAAEQTGLSVRTLERMAQKGEGPPRIKLSQIRVGYRRSDLDRWIAERPELIT